MPLERVTLKVNETEHPVELEARRTLLDALRNDLGLTGTKKSCDMGNCGACTVIMDGRAAYACLLFALDCHDRSITTVEGLHDDPLQKAFMEADAFQCGFCTPGQLMSLKALFSRNPTPSDEEIVRAVSGNLCRCGAYRNIVRAARIVAGRE
jgi:xanthine dehydrogenase YagT iron-sulfur-binding subunit